MTYKLLVILHLLGATVWVGGHVVLVRTVLPRALRTRDPAPVLEFERAFGGLGLLALLAQLVTGLLLAHRWLGSWGGLLDEPTPVAHLILAKGTLLVASVALGVHAHRFLLPRLSAERLRGFAVHAWIVTLLGVLMLVAGAGIRLGGFH